MGILSRSGGSGGSHRAQIAALIDQPTTQRENRSATVPPSLLVAADEVIDRL